MNILHCIPRIEKSEHLSLMLNSLRVLDMVMVSIFMSFTNCQNLIAPWNLYFNGSNGTRQTVTIWLRHKPCILIRLTEQRRRRFSVKCQMLIDAQAFSPEKRYLNGSQLELFALLRPTRSPSNFPDTLTHQSLMLLGSTVVWKHHYNLTLYTSLLLRIVCWVGRATLATIWRLRILTSLSLLDAWLAPIQAALKALTMYEMIWNASHIIMNTRDVGGISEAFDGQCLQQ